MQQPQIQMLAYVTLAMLLGGLIGLDREAARKPAGLRTHMRLLGYVENRFAEQPAPAAPAEEQP